jgi:polysaccharide export outer membrane protein
MLATAGGTSLGGDDLVIIVGARNGKPFRQTVDVPAIFLNEKAATDLVLMGGDVIYVHRAPVYYIYGEAQRPGSYRIERGMTVMQALAQGGGPSTRGSERRLRLSRKSTNGSVKLIEPELTDPVLPDDVIYVKESIF